jgi:hypothetical protein
MRTLRRLTVVTLAAASVPCATGHDFHAGAIAVDRARTAPSVAGQREDAAFMTVTNDGKDDVLIGVACSVANSVELRAAVPVDGGTRVRTVEAIPIPANTTLEFKPQGYHLALIGLNYSFAPGERIAATLRFASGTELPVEFQVEEAADGSSGPAAATKAN